MTNTPARAGGDLIARAVQPLILIGVMWIVRVLDAILPGDWNRAFGLESWALDGLGGVLLSPWLHANWPHLLANTVPLLILGVLAALDGIGRFWSVTLVIAVISGLGTWLVNAPGTVTVGASGLVFGYFGYLLVRAFVARSLGHGLLYAIIALAVVVGYGSSMLAGVFGAAPGISWQAHLFGAIGGGVAAILTRPSARARGGVSREGPP